MLILTAALEYHVPEIYKMETPWGIPLGLVIFVLIIVKSLTAKPEGRNGASQTNFTSNEYTQGEMHEHRLRHQRMLNLAHKEEEQRRSRIQTASPPAMRVDLGVLRLKRENTGNALVQLINDTAERTGYCAYHVGALIQVEARVRFKIENDKVNITEGELAKLEPKMDAVARFCERLALKPIEASRNTE